MASTQFFMQRFSGPPEVVTSRPLQQNVAFCARRYFEANGVVPTVCHVSLCLQEVPANVGPVRIERAWGLYPQEMDLGVEQ